MGGCEFKFRLRLQRRSLGRVYMSLQTFISTSDTLASNVFPKSPSLARWRLLCASRSLGGPAGQSPLRNVYLSRAHTLSLSLYLSTGVRSTRRGEPGDRHGVSGFLYADYYYYYALCMVKATPRNEATSPEATIMSSTWHHPIEFRATVSDKQTLSLQWNVHHRLIS